MRLTIGRKLGLLIGVLMGLFIITGLNSFTQTRFLYEKIKEITELEEPISAAAYEMEINVIGTGLGVLKYLDSADAEYREWVEKDEADFHKSLTRYLQLVKTEERRELGLECADLYHEFWALGEAMMAKKAYQEELFAVIAADFTKIDRMIEAAIKPEMDAIGTEGFEKAIKALQMEVDIAEVNSRFQNYLRTQSDQYKKQLFQSAGDFETGLVQLKNLGSTEEERQSAVKIESLFNEIMYYIRELLYINDFIEENIEKFIDLRTALDTLLDNEIKALTYKNLSRAKEDAHRTARRAITILIVAVPFVLLTGMFVAWIITRSITRPVAGLLSATNAVAKGDFTQRVDIRSKDEIGILGGHFNNMAEDLKQYFNERMQTQESLRKARDELEQRVEDRTAELVAANAQLMLEIEERKQAQEERNKLADQLQRAQKMEAIGTLAGGVAHDLNNVLSGMVLYPDLLLMQLPEDSPLRKSIRAIQDSGKKAAAIVQDLLALARRGVHNKELVNLNDIISEYLNSLEHNKLKLYHPGVEVEADLKADLLNLSGFPVHLSKTVMNLVTNAAEAMTDGGKIFISTENRYIDKPLNGYDNVKEGDYVILKVSDSGIGISAEDMERIFEPFYTKKKMGRSGTGLGMAVVWGTVRDHNGYIDVQSAVGKGTTFTLYFPASRQEIAKAKVQPSIEAYMGKGESILVVDDVKEQREMAATLLTTLGYAADTVSSGEEAVAYLKEHTVDLVILDMIMDPGIDGLDTYKEIIKVHPYQKAIIASGFSESERVKEAQRLGVGRYIKKPYTLETIGLAVKAELMKMK